MSKQVEMLDKVMTILERKAGMRSLEAYETLLQMLAYQLSYQTSIISPTLKQEIFDEVVATLDIPLLKEVVWDHLGELYEQREIGNPRTGQFFTPKTVSDTMAALNTGDIPETVIEPFRMLDPAVGSGRLILSVFNLHNNKFFYYGADIDLVAYRTALINMKLYDIPSKILHCDSLKHDLSPSSDNWHYANMWNPVKFDKLLEMDAMTI